MGDTHATTRGDVESSKLAVLVDDGNEAYIVGKEVDVVLRRDGDGNFVLAMASISHTFGCPSFAHLSRQVEFAVEGLDVL